MTKYITWLIVALAIIGGAFLLAGGEPARDVKSALEPQESFVHAHGMAVDIEDPTKVYIATHQGLYLLQNDSDLYRIGKTRDDLMGFTAHPKEANVFFSSGHPLRGGNIGFQQSTDGGTTWKKVSDALNGPVDFHSMAVSSANPDIVYGFYGGRLQLSKDGGKSWQYAKGAVSPIALATHPRDENIAYASTRDGVKVSYDQGESWENLSDDLSGGSVTVFLLNPSDPNYALTFSEALGGLGKSADGGKTFAKVAENFNGEMVMYISWSSSAPQIVYAVTGKNSVYKSTDAGESWQKIR